MKHIRKPADAAEGAAGKLSFVTITVYAVLFGAWLLLQLH